MTRERVPDVSVNCVYCSERSVVNQWRGQCGRGASRPPMRCADKEPIMNDITCTDDVTGTDDDDDTETDK